MKSRIPFLLGATLLGACLALGSCKSNEPEVDLSSVPCTCGQPIAQIEGCAHPTCVSGERNPDNPDCLCAPLDLDGGGE